MEKEPIVKDPEIRREWFSGSQPMPGIPGMEAVPRDGDGGPGAGTGADGRQGREAGSRHPGPSDAREAGPRRRPWLRLARALRSLLAGPGDPQPSEIFLSLWPARSGMAKEPVEMDPEIRREWFSGSRPKPGIPGMEVVLRDDDDEPGEDPSG